MTAAMLILLVNFAALPLIGFLLAILIWFGRRSPELPAVTGTPLPDDSHSPIT